MLRTAVTSSSVQPFPAVTRRAIRKEEATENIREAIEAYRESLEQDNTPVPRAVEPEIESVRVRG